MPLSKIKQANKKYRHERKRYLKQQREKQLKYEAKLRSRRHVTNQQRETGITYDKDI